MTRGARRTMSRRMILIQLAGLVMFLVFAAGALFAILPLYLRDDQNKLLLPAFAGQPVVSWVTGLALLAAGTVAWVVVAVLFAWRMNEIVEWILHRIGVRLGAAKQSDMSRIWTELADWEPVIDGTTSDLLVTSALMSGEVFLDQFRNHYTAIRAAASLLKQAWQGPEEHLQQFEQTIDEIGLYLDQLECWVRRDMEHVTPVNMVNLVERARDRAVYGQGRVNIQAYRGQVAPLVHGLEGLLLAVVEKLIHCALAVRDAHNDPVSVQVTLGGAAGAGSGAPPARVIVRIEGKGKGALEEAAALVLPPGRAHSQPDGPSIYRAFLALHEGNPEYQEAEAKEDREVLQISLPLATVALRKTLTNEVQ